MDLTPTVEEAAFRDEVRAWLEANHPGDEPTDDTAAFGFRRQWQRKLHSGGWAGISWPAEYGGRGATLIEQAIFGEVMTETRSPTPVNILGLVMGGPVVIAHGTEEQKERWLEPILSAEEIWCQGFSEPDSGSDLASLKTRVWTTFAHESKWCMLLARTDPDAPKHKGLTYFILDMEQEGVEVRPLVQITGEAEFNEIFLDGAYVPDDSVVGVVGNGWMVGITTLMHERAGLGAGAAIQVRRDLDQLIEELARRGLGDDPMIRDRVAKLKIGVEALRLGALRALTQQMKLGIPGPEGAISKWQWANQNQALTELAGDALGPEALEVGSEWSYRLLRSRANSIEGGTTDVMKNILAERVLGLPKLR